MSSGPASDTVDLADFGKTDYVMLGIMLCVSLAIGVFFAISGNRQRTKVDYLLGNRRMGALPVCMSLFATFQSAISLLGTPAEVYTYGIMILYSTVGIVLSYLVGLVTVVPLIYPLKITSVFEYLERRFHSRTIRLFATLVGILNSVSYMTIALLSPALALQTVVGLPLWLSIISAGAVGTIYTAIGGIKSVVWTDVFQTVIIFGGIIVILVKGSIDVGGMSRVWHIASENGRIIYDEIDPDPRTRHTVWGLIFGGVVYWTSVHFSQSSVQRIAATKTLNKAKLTLALAIPLVTLYGAVMLLTGLVLLAYLFTIGCDPMAAGYISNPNQLMPYFVMQSLSFLPGLPGLYMATIFSGALSTLSSGINSLTANTVEDFLGGVLANKRESTVTVISKIIVCLYGTAIIGLAYLAREASGPVTQTTYSALSATAGPLLGLFVLGATFPQANSIGSICGLGIGLITSMWVSVGSFLYRTATPSLPFGPVHSCSADNVSRSAVGSTISLDDWQDYHTGWPNTTAHSPVLATTQIEETINLQRESTRDFTIYDLSYVWLPLIGFLATVVSGLILSIISGRFTQENNLTDPRLLFPFARRLWEQKEVSDVKMMEPPYQGLDLRLSNNYQNPSIQAVEIFVDKPKDGHQLHQEDGQHD